MIQKIKTHLGGDKQIWWILILLSLVSIVTVYSSISSLAFRKAGGNTESILLKHSSFVFAGVAIAYFIHLVDITKYRKFIKICMLASLILLVGTLIFGTSIGQARRWITFGPISFQTADLVKVLLIITLAELLAGKIHIEYKRKHIIELMMWIGVTIFLITISSFSSSVILTITCVTIMWIGKVPGHYLGKTIGISLSAIFSMLLIGAVLSSFGIEMGRFSTVIDRTEVFINLDINRDGHIGGVLGGKSSQKNLAHMAIANGGIIGVGPGNSTLKNSLPEAYSDYIYSIIVEEYGLIGGIFTLILYLWLLRRGIANIDLSDRAFAGLVSIGLTLLLVFQAFAHIAVNVGLGPVTGQTLPIISRGGTSALFSYIALGIVLSVSRYSKPSTK